MAGGFARSRFGGPSHYDQRARNCLYTVIVPRHDRDAHVTLSVNRSRLTLWLNLEQREIGPKAYATRQDRW
jgi:hypothetical protein